MEIAKVNEKIREEEEKQFLELSVKVLSQMRLTRDKYQKDLTEAMEDEQRVIDLIKANDGQGLLNFKPRRYNPQGF